MEVPRHPWRRYFARLLDISLYGLPFLAVELLWFHIPIKTFDRWWFQLLNSYLAYGVMLLVEPFLLHFWATTPGKALFGITVRDPEGEKPSLYWARRRTFEVFAYGLGFGLPFYTVYRQYQSWKTVRQREYNEWEWTWGGRSERMEIPGGFAPWLAWGFAQLFTLVLTLLLARQSLLPPNRGELTLAAFAENYNFYVQQLSLPTYLLSQEGQLRDNPGSGLGELWNQPQLEGLQWVLVRDGQGDIIGFSYAVEREDDSFSLRVVLQFPALLAVAGAREETNCLNFSPWWWYRFLMDQATNCDASFRGIRLSRRVECPDFTFYYYGGYRGFASPTYHTESGEEARYRIEFAVTHN